MLNRPERLLAHASGYLLFSRNRPIVDGSQPPDVDLSVLNLLFLPESNHRIDAGCTNSWQEAATCDHRKECDCRTSENGPVVRSHAKEECRHRVASQEHEWDTEYAATQNEPQGFAKYSPKNVRLRGAECHTEAKL